METETVNDRRAMSGKPRYRAESMRSQLRRHCCILAFFGCGIVAGCGGEEERVPPPLSTLRASWHTTLDSLRKLSESDPTNFVPLEKYAQAVNERQADTWRQYAWVASRFEISSRLEIVDWSTHHSRSV